jgi:predicted O-linked N-acetylglucosamine transferase (SPINDLY family)
VPNIPEQLEQAIALHRQGLPAQAESLYRNILQMDPSHAAARQNLAVALFEQRHLQDALEQIEAAIGLAPTNAIAHNTRGNILRELHRPQDALESYERALQIDPTYATAYSNRSDPLLTLGRHRDALASADQAITLNPRLAVAECNRGKALAMLERFEEALGAYDQALALVPDWPLVLANRSGALLLLGRPEAALHDSERALKLAPDDPIVLNAHGNVLRKLQRFQDALRCYDRAVALDPALAAAHYNRGNVLLDLQQPQAAVASFDRSIELSPQWAAAQHDRGVALLRLGRIDEASLAYLRSLELNPDLPYTRGQALHTLLLQADWSAYEDLSAEVIASNTRGELADEPLSFLALTDSAQAQVQCARRCVSDRYLSPLPPLWAGEHYTHSKIRVAYLSGDLGEHPVSYLMAGVFEQHDQQRFETIGLSLQRARPGSGYARRAHAAFARFLEVGARTDEEIAHLIRESEVDILVDLVGFTRGMRLPVLARRPAPVQLSYLGYPGSLAAPYIDYFLADEWVIPPRARSHYTEKIVALPDTYQANDDRRVLTPPPSREQAGLPVGSRVLCVFNATYKISPKVFEIWCAVLRAVPDSVLWLLGTHERSRVNLRREAEQRGVAPERLIFAERVTYEEHLARLQLADLYLDTFPFNGGASASDALWAGVPLITCAGEAFASRMGGSLLKAVGLPELICESLEQYEHRALEVASDPAQLAAMRKHLTQHRRSAPLFDAARFCRHLEQAYLVMHERVRRGEQPSDITVEQISPAPPGVAVGQA